MEEDKKQGERNMPLTEALDEYAVIVPEADAEHSLPNTEVFRWRREGAEEDTAKSGTRIRFGLPGRYQMYFTGMREDDPLSVNAGESFGALTCNGQRMLFSWFMVRYLSTDEGKELEALLRKGAFRSEEDLASYKITVPPVEEQRAYLASLSEEEDDPSGSDV